MDSRTGSGRLIGLILETAIILAALAVALVVRLYFIQSAEIISSSMVPTLLVGDRFLYTRIRDEYRPQRGDIVSIVFDEEIMANEELVKRVIALPGEEIGIFNQRVYINGKPLDEPYIKEPMQGDAVSYRIPRDTIFVMGDNRNNSEDSRMWGPIPLKSVHGRASLIYWPLSRAGRLK